MFIKIYLINKLQFDLIININVLNKDNINLLLSRQTLRIKNTETLLCYTSSSPLINRINSMSLIDNYKKYYFYYFNAYTNNDNVTASKA